MDHHLLASLAAGVLAALLLLTGSASLVRGPVVSGTVLVLVGLLVVAVGPFARSAGSWRLSAAEGFAFLVLASTLLREATASARGEAPLEPWDDAAVGPDGAGGDPWASRRTRVATRARSASPRSR